MKIVPHIILINVERSIKLFEMEFNPDALLFRWRVPMWNSYDRMSTICVRFFSYCALVNVQRHVQLLLGPIVHKRNSFMDYFVI